MKPGEVEKKAASLMREDENRLVHQMVHDFSTWEPFDHVLRKQLNLIGYFFRTWIGAEKTIHFFTNPDIKRVDWMLIGENEKNIPEMFVEDRTFFVKPVEKIQEITDGNLLILCEKLMGGNKRYLFLPFSQHDAPFGQFVLSFSDYFPGNFILEKVKGTLNILQMCLKDILYNNYPITSFTYLPSFQTQRTAETAILFCDVRDSTAMFEIARMANNEKYTEMLILLLKSFQEYASRIISVNNIGWIHRFMGDGLLATFGDYLTLEPLEKANIACALSLLTANLLKEGFDNLWSLAQDSFMNVDFLGVYNEDIDLRLGIGLNYGRVRFDVFGMSIEKSKHHSMASRGYSEFTAIGDHMSFAQRLCSVANQPLSSVNFTYRSEKLKKSRLTSPIIASRTVTYWTRQCLKTNGDPLDIFRTDFQLKGKGHPMPGFEIWPDALDVDQLLNCIKNIHKNQFYDAIIDEYENKTELDKVNRHFISQLKQVEQEYGK